MSNWTNDAILDALRGVVEPDLGKDVVSLDLVEVEGTAGDHGAGLTLTVKSSNPAMHARKRMQEAVEFALERAFGKPVSCDVKVIPLKQEERTLETRKVLPGVEHVIAVASGKGGVGKSTVSSNLAVALAQLGYTVGLVDADIHGPSVPTMFDVAGEKPQPAEVEGKTKIEPIEQYGVKVLSIGFFADPDQAIVWRGPMASRALNQLFTDADWGKLDFMIVDLPPGTGDIHLSLVQQIPLSGAVIVSTPQDVALADARKGVGMFRLDELKVPVLGMVENMAYFVPPDMPEKKYHIFGRDGVKRLADSLEAPFLGELPLLQTIREAGDAGRPAALQTNGEAAAAFRAVVANLLEQLGKDV
ncbi:MAG: Mrp/NBP35 family ATP-binding protein [Bacteroidota bacterium]|nr:Mrp/NBP35 family ATP-binding protein [Bacteroidota bacterium]